MTPRRAGLLPVLCALLGALACWRPPAAAEPMALSAVEGDARFDPAELVAGTVSDAATCRTISGAVWVRVEERGDCIRYYAGGLKPGRTNPDAIVFLHGDVLNVLTNGAGVQAPEPYGETTPSGITRNVRRWAEEAGRPVLFIAKPGTFGSSGDHKERRRPREVALVAAALDQIKRRHGLERLHLAGQSGGGHMVAALIAQRRDIGCAVIAAGATAVRQRWQELGRAADLTGFADVYDPIDHVTGIPRRPAPRIIVISDPRDRRVSISSQSAYLDRLRDIDFSPLHVIAGAPAPDYHGLAGAARMAARLCADGATEADIAMAVQTRWPPPASQ